MDEKRKRIIAIMGPSGAGKTTLGYGLAEKYGFAIPRHCTTRARRSDDKEGFYRYLPHEEYARYAERGEFLITSGDHPVIARGNGNFYGVLQQDCEEALQDADTAVLFVSYKDIERLQSLKGKNGIEIDIVNLTFRDIPKGVEQRIKNDPARNHTQDDIRRRVDCAIADHEKYKTALQRCADLTIYTEMHTIEQTIEKVAQDLSLDEK